MNTETAGIVEIILGLMVAAVPLALLARRLRIPYPVMLVLGGLAIGFMPGVPQVQLAPSLVFSLFLPPILYEAAFTTSWRDFKANRRSIFLLAIGLVIFTTLVFGYAMHAIIPALPLISALLLGAIISPTDAAAATSVMHKLNLPRRIVTIVEGESLVNDATGLVAFTLALGAVESGTIDWFGALAQFCWLVIAGIVIGFTIGRISIYLHRFMKDGSIEVLTSLIMPFLTYLIAESMQSSGVLAVVTLGLVRARHSSTTFNPQQRIVALALWDMIVFLINTLAFILIGMQMKTILHHLSGYATVDLIRYGVLAAFTTAAIRMVWVFPAAYIPRLLFRKIRDQDPFPRWQSVAIVGWSGMRGVVSLAAALSLPGMMDEANAIPGRDLVIYLAFCVILGSLVFQGVTLGWLIEKLKVGADTEGPAEERLARLEMSKAAVEFLGRLRQHNTFPGGLLDEVSAEFSQRIEDLECTDKPHNPDDFTATTEHRRRVRLEALAAQRDKIQQLRDEGTIGDDVMHRIEHRLDYYEAGLM